MRAAVITLILVALVAAGGYFWTRSPSTTGGAATASGTTASPGAAARETTAPVARGDVNFTVGVAGEIGPAEQVSVRPEVNGRINELPVDVGDRVKKGGLLFALDDRDLRIEVETRQKQIESANLQLDKARITMEQAKRDYQRDQQLFEAKLLAGQAFEAARERFDSSVKDHELARNSIERTKNELALAEERLQKTRIVAPFDCTVLTRPISLGQAVSGSGGFNSGTEVMTIADLTALVINAHVNQADVTRLRQGMDVDVEVDAIPGLKIHGVVDRIAPQATVRNNIKGYATRIALKDLDPRVQPGMTANVSIPVSTALDVLTVPISAVFSEQNERYVLVKKGEDFERRPVMLGVSDYFRVEIKSGLAQGEIVALEQPGGVAARIPGGTPAVASLSAPGSGRGSTGSVSSASGTPHTTPGTAGTARPAAVGSTPATGTVRPATSRPGA